MKLSEWRPALVQWLKTQLAVTSEALDRPDMVGHTQLVIEPIRDVTVREIDPMSTLATGYQDVIYSIRLNGDLPYSQLGLEYYEGLYLSMLLKFTKRWQDIHPGLVDLSTDNDNRLSTAQLQLTEASDGQGDWLLDLTWSLQLQWEAELEDEPIFSGAITQLNIWLYRSDLSDFDLKTLDAHIEVSNE